MLMWVTRTCIVQQVLEKPDKEWYTQVIDGLLTEFHICPLTSNMT